MAPIFDRPNAAFHAYELSLLRPRSWPPTRHDIPTLWARAKAMFAVMLATITSVADLTRRMRFDRKARRALVARLVPVEKLVRILMKTEAATFLLMTHEGRKLRAETPKIEPPAPPPPVGIPKPSSETRILMPGWQTIAAYHPYIDPRVVEREQREALERIATLETLMQDPITPDIDPNDPQHWRCRFRVLRWVHDRDPDAEPQALRLQPRPRFFSYADTNYPIVPGMTVIDDRTRASSDDDAALNTSLHMGRDLARRIEALARILVNPAAAIRRLARRLASLPADTLPLPGIAPHETSGWHHGIPENWNAHALAKPAFRALVRATAHKHDPG